MFGQLLALFRQFRRQWRELPYRATLDRTDLAALSTQATPDPTRVLVLRTDSIGDYLLFRPWLRQLADEVHRRGQRLTLLANTIWAPLAQAWDADCFDELIAVEVGRFGRDMVYRAEVLAGIGASGYGEVINPLHVRQPAMENFIRYLHAPVRQASEGAHQTGAWFETLNTSYTQVLPSAREVRFEYVRNGEFFQNWRRAGQADPRHPVAALRAAATDNELAEYMRQDAPLQLPKDTLAAGAMEAEKGRYIVLVPGASARQKQWPAASFGRLARALHQLYRSGYRLVLAGGPADENLARSIVRHAIPNVVFDNRCGRTDLPELAALLAGASLVISNDTAAAHFAAQAGTPTLVLLMGENYGKFFPYPPVLLRAPSRCLFPPSQQVRLAKGDFSPPPRDPAINRIVVERVLSAATELLTAGRLA